MGKHIFVFKQKDLLFLPIQPNEIVPDSESHSWVPFITIEQAFIPFLTIKEIIT